MELGKQLISEMNGNEKTLMNIRPRRKQKEFFMKIV